MKNLLFMLLIFLSVEVNAQKQFIGYGYYIVTEDLKVHKKPRQFYFKDAEKANELLAGLTKSDSTFFDVKVLLRDVKFYYVKTSSKSIYIEKMAMFQKSNGKVVYRRIK